MPIEEFETQQQLNECLKWWQSKLHLNHWLIKARIVGIDEIDENNCGENHFVFESNESAIRILRKEDFSQECIIKYCAELILVHELLHLKYDFMKPCGTFESVFYDTMEHQKLEEMAKTLIMVKYNLDLDWFRAY